MIAQIVTFQGNQYAFLAAPPNWATEIKIGFELPTDIAKEPITFAESRRNFAQSARYKMSWTSYLSNAADATELRIFLTRVRGEQVAAPLWPDVCETYQDSITGVTALPTLDRPVRYGPVWVVTNSDFSVLESVTVTSITGTAGSYSVNLLSPTTLAWPTGSFLYPLIVGRLDERPQPEAITDETLEAVFTIKETSGFVSRLVTPIVTLSTVGSNIPEFSSLLKWDVAPNYVRPLDWTEIPDVVYEHIGFLREEQQRAYDHRTPRGQELEFYQADRDSLTEIEYFWRSCLATTLRFMIPTYRGDLRMLVDTTGTSVIRCEKSFFSNPGREAQPGDSFIALIDANNNVVPYLLSSTTDLAQETQLNTTTPVAGLPAASTIVSHLLLARFADPVLEWTYTTPYLATTRLKFVELPHEYSSDYLSDFLLAETGDNFITEAGVTLITEPHNVPPPLLPQPAYLFIFNEVGIQIDRFTSYENTITVPSGTYAGTYTSAPFSFDTVKVGLKLDQEKLEFKSFKFTGNPLNKMWPFGLDGILTLEIVEVDATSPSSTTAISRFYGDVWSIDSDYKATAIPFGNLFDRQFPRFLLSVSDNYTQFSPPTNISAASFQYTGTLPNVIDKTSQLLIVTSSGGAAQGSSFFAGGWLETGTGSTLEKRSILESAPFFGSNQLQLFIDRPLLKAVGSQAFVFYPGYDASIDQCETKFSNRINFGGHPFIPNINPSVKAIKPKKTSGGKKA